MVPKYGEQVHYVAYPPYVHPMTGKRMLLMTNIIDRIITKEQADKLERHYNRKAAQGSMPMNKSE